MNNAYSYLDAFGIPYIPILLFLGQQVVARNSGNSLYRQYFMTGLKYKIIGSVLFYGVYAFYYGGGDTVNFFFLGNTLKEYMLEHNFADGLAQLFSTTAGSENLPYEITVEASERWVFFLLRDTSSMMVGRLSAVLSIFGLGSFLCTGLLFAFISYLAVFRLFVTFCEIFPERYTEFSFSFLKIPSVIFWGSGVNKDTVCLTAICILLYGVYWSFIRFRISLSGLVMIVVAIFLLFTVRSYILISMLPGLVFWIMKSAQKRVASGILNQLFAPVMVVSTIIVVVLLFNNLSATFEQFSLQEIERRAEGFKTWHQTIQESKGGSGYTLGIQDYSVGSVILYSPLALAITLFGPFPWQVRNVVMFFSSIEALYFLYLFLRSFIGHGGIVKILKAFDEPVLFFCFTFTVVLGVAIGLTSFNYGALVRYKIPLLPFFSVALILLTPQTIKFLKKQRK